MKGKLGMVQAIEMKWPSALEQVGEKFGMVAELPCLLLKGMDGLGKVLPRLVTIYYLNIKII